MNYKKKLRYLFLYLTILALSSCGVKPAFVDPPEGAEHNTFPRTYPDASTDPMPGMEKKSI